MLSAWRVHDQVVELLLSNGADRSRKDHHGFTAFYGLKEGEHWKSLLKRHWYDAPLRAGSCDLNIGYASIFKPNLDSWSISGYQFDGKPEEGTEGWVITANASVRLKIESVKPNEYTRIELGKDAWDVEFESYDGAAFNSIEMQGAGLTIWPAPDTVSILETPHREDLPWGMDTDIVKLAVDLDGDNKPDVLDLAFCCRDPLSGDLCEYYCSQYWLKVEGCWMKCVSSSPA